MSLDQSESKTFCKMADADGFFRGETLDIFLGMLDESKFDLLIEEEMENIGREVISYRQNRYTI